MRTIEIAFDDLSKTLMDKGCELNTNTYSSIKKEENLKSLLKTVEGKYFIKLLKNLPVGTEIRFATWANKFTRTDKGFLSSFGNKKLSVTQFALDRIKANSTTGLKSSFTQI